MRAAAVLLAAPFAAVLPTAAEVPGAETDPWLPRASGGPEGLPEVPAMPMRASPLDRSLAELVASGWRVVGVTVSDRIFQYHLVGEGALTVCFLDTRRDVPASECIRLSAVPG